MATYAVHRHVRAWIIQYPRTILETIELMLKRHFLTEGRKSARLLPTGPSPMPGNTERKSRDLVLTLGRGSR